jgi:hypothetical protein
MHILPTRGRPAILQRFFDQGRPQEDGVVIIDEDQVEMYDEVQLPPSWRRMVVASMQGFVKKCNIGFEAYPKQEWYAFGGADCVGRTPGWDTSLAQYARAGKIAWGNDLDAGRCTHPFIHGDLCRKLGGLVHPAFKRSRHDSHF